MKITPLLTALFALPTLALLTGCEDKKAAEEYNAPMAEGIAALEKTEKAEEGVQIVDKQVTLSLQVPSPAWTVRIDEAWVVGEELWVIAKLAAKQDVASPQVITDVEDSITIKQIPDLPVTYYVLGKTFKWTPEGRNVKFIDSTKSIQVGLNSGEQVYPEK